MILWHIPSDFKKFRTDEVTMLGKPQTEDDTIINLTNL